MTKTIFSILILWFVTLSVFGMDASHDENESKMKEYEMKKAVIVERSRNWRPIDGAKLDPKRIPYRVMLGNGEKTKLSHLAGQMNTPHLAQNLIWGESYNAFVGGLIASIISLLVLDITGFAMLGATYDYYDMKNTTNETTHQYFSNRPAFTASLVLLSCSGLPLSGIILFAVFMARSFKYRFNYLQATSLAKQYNKFLKRKLGVPLDVKLNYNFNQNQVGLLFSFRF